MEKIPTENKSTLKRLYQRWKEVMFNPEVFFSQIELKDKYRGASKYFLKIQSLVTGLFLLMMLMMITFSDRTIPESLGISTSTSFLFSLLLLVILFPLFVLIAWGMLYVNAGITHLFVLIFGGKQGYVETYKVLAYSVSPSIFTIIPFVNWISWIYVLILQVIGIKHLQKLSWAKSVAVIVVPLALILSIFLIVYIKYLLPILLASLPAAGGIV